MLCKLAGSAQIQLLHALGVTVELYILQNADSEFGHNVPPL